MTLTAIRGGLILDGTGNPGFYATVLIDDERLSLIRGDTSHIAVDRTIDAMGKVVCPGFIDLHSHAGLTILGEPHHDPKVRQGVTTELIGVDGISHAPFRSTEELERYIWLDSGLNGYPPQRPDWLTVREFLDKFDRTVAINVAYILGNGPVRIWSVGWGRRRASSRELADMQAVTREAMQEGAWALSTGLDYPPSSFADAEELLALSAAAHRLGGFFHTHTRKREPRPADPLASFREAIEIGERSGIAVHLTHYSQRRRGEGSHHAYLDLVDAARARGIDVTFDCYPYAIGSTTLAIEVPHWTKDGGPEVLMAALDDSAGRARIRAEMLARPGIDRFWHENWLTNFRLLDHAPYDGLTLAEIGALRGEAPVESMLTLLREERLGITVVSVSANEMAVPDFVSHPSGMIASDSVMIGQHPNPRTYGCFPTVLGEFVREGRYLSLAEAIRKMTSMPAQRLGLMDRGLLRDGYVADIVIFDPNTVRSPATRLEPRQYPIGIDQVLVNGVVVVDAGANTGALPGRVLRRGQ